MIFIFLAIFLMFNIVVEKILVQRFSIRKKKVPYKHVNEIHKWFEILFAIVLISIILYITSESKLYYYLGGLVMLSSFRAVMEWKFEKGSKVYILNIFYAAVTIFLLATLKLFF